MSLTERLPGALVDGISGRQKGCFLSWLLNETLAVTTYAIQKVNPIPQIYTIRPLLAAELFANSGSASPASHLVAKSLLRLRGGWGYFGWPTEGPYLTQLGNSGLKQRLWSHPRIFYRLHSMPSLKRPWGNANNSKRLQYLPNYKTSSYQLQNFSLLNISSPACSQDWTSVRTSHDCFFSSFMMSFIWSTADVTIALDGKFCGIIAEFRVICRVGYLLTPVEDSILPTGEKLWTIQLWVKQWELLDPRGDPLAEQSNRPLWQDVAELEFDERG
jgi:hypothetical protein